MSSSVKDNTSSPKKTHISEAAQYTVQKRLEGVAVKTIAEDLGVTRTCIYNILNKFPKASKKLTAEHVLEHTLPLQEEYEIALCYLRLYSSPENSSLQDKKRFQKQIVQKIAIEKDLDFEQVIGVFYRITALHPTTFKYPYYTAIEQWKARNFISTSKLAELLGISSQELNEILNAWKHMPLSIAKKIRSVSGLPLVEIYSDLLKIDSQLDQSNRNTAHANSH